MISTNHYTTKIPQALLDPSLNFTVHIVCLAELYNCQPFFFLMPIYILQRQKRGSDCELVYLNFSGFDNDYHWPEWLPHSCRWYIVVRWILYDFVFDEAAVICELNWWSILVHVTLKGHKRQLNWQGERVLQKHAEVWWFTLCCLQTCLL